VEDEDFREGGFSFVEEGVRMDIAIIDISSVSVMDVQINA
jgi:hypothetical protein